MLTHIMFHPGTSKTIGSATAALLLRAVEDCHYGNHKEPFSSFATPCDDDGYEEGDSLSEYMGLTTKEFNSALKLIGTKVKDGAHRATLKRVDETETNDQLIKRLVLYWKDFNGATWWEPNIPAINELFSVRRILSATRQGE